MARSAIEAGYEVVVYARWEPGSPLETEGDGYRIIRVPALAMLAVPGRRRRALDRIAHIRANAETGQFAEPTSPRARLSLVDRLAQVLTRSIRKARGTGVLKGSATLRGVVSDAQLARRWLVRAYRKGNRIAQKRRRPIDNLRKRLILFPFRPMGWAKAVEVIAEPADVWHGMWAGSLPALDALHARFGGRTIYDSRDIYMRSRGFETVNPLLRKLLAKAERRWAARCDAVITVNDSYADILRASLRIPRPPIVRNTPSRYTRPDPAPDRIRELLGLPRSTRIVLYQGAVMTERGVEQGMDAILEVPDAVFVTMGYGGRRDAIIKTASSEPYRDKVRVIDPVPPQDLLDWTSSADVMLMAIQPTTLNHRYTTPNKLWEAIAAGIPIVASDLDGMAGVINEIGCGVLVDGTDPASIARGIRQILDAAPEEVAGMKERALAAAATKYNWEAQVGTLLAIYEQLLGEQVRPSMRS
jgi:glycogen(starch) synthase